jgi:membrane protein DedA with SNARE-associated domain
MEKLIQDYGYFIIFFLTLLEGESVLFVGGFAAHQGFLNLEWVIVFAFVGSTLGDQFFFQLAKWKGASITSRFPVLARNYPRAQRLVQRFGSYIVLMARYMYGIRTPLVMICGAARMSTIRFTILNVLAAAIWAVSFGMAGYLLGRTAEIVIGDIGRYANIVIGALIVLTSVLWGVRHLKGGKSLEGDL